MLALFLMRTAGLPVEALGSVRSPQAMAQFEAIAQRKASMARDAQCLQDAIHTIIGIISPNPAHRDAVRTLMALKRDLHLDVSELPVVAPTHARSEGVETT